MQRIIISGATSMLGLALINECIKRQIELVAIVREGSPKKVLIPDSSYITTVECNLSNINSFSLPRHNSYDTFYHFAWEGTDNSTRNSVDIQSNNIEYTLNAVSFAHRNNCKKFIGVGSQAEYGRVDGIISPNMKVSPDSAYGIAKYAAGKLSSILCEQLKMEFIWTRVFSTYGVNDIPSTMIMYCIDSLLKKQKPILTKCEQKWDYLNCEDAGQAFYLLGEKGKDKSIYNIGSGQAKSLSDYVSTIRNSIDKSLEVGFGEKQYAPNQVMYLCADIANLTADTGFVPKVSFEDGIRNTIRWYKGMMK